MVANACFAPPWARSGTGSSEPTREPPPNRTWDLGLVVPIHPARWNAPTDPSRWAPGSIRRLGRRLPWLGWRFGFEHVCAEAEFNTDRDPGCSPECVDGCVCVLARPPLGLLPRELADLAASDVERFDNACAALEGRVDELRARLNGDAPSDLANVRRVLSEISHALCELELAAAWLGGAR